MQFLQSGRPPGRAFCAGHSWHQKISSSSSSSMSLFRWWPAGSHCPSSTKRSSIKSNENHSRSTSTSLSTSPATPFSTPTKLSRSPSPWSANSTRSSLWPSTHASPASMLTRKFDNAITKNKLEAEFSNTGPDFHDCLDGFERQLNGRMDQLELELAGKMLHFQEEIDAKIMECVSLLRLLKDEGGDLLRSRATFENKIHEMDLVVGLVTDLLGKLAGNVVEHHNALTSPPLLAATTTTTSNSPPLPREQALVLSEDVLAATRFQCQQYWSKVNSGNVALIADNVAGRCKEWTVAEEKFKWLWENGNFSEDGRFVTLAGRTITIEDVEEAERRCRETFGLPYFSRSLERRKSKHTKRFQGIGTTCSPPPAHSAPDNQSPTENVDSSVIDDVPPSLLPNLASIELEGI